MRPKYRYSLIILGLLLFPFLATGLIFYVRGIKLDLQNSAPQTTGILTIKSSPEKALITLNGQATGLTPKDIRFLLPGEYQVTLSKPGYQTWQKRLFVSENKVTWAQSEVKAIQLFKHPTNYKILDSNVSDFVLAGKIIFYVTPTALVKAESDDYTKKSYYSLSLDSYQIKTTSNPEFHILWGKKHKYIFNSTDQKLIKLETTNQLADIDVSLNGTLYVQHNQTLTTHSQSISTPPLLTLTNTLAYTLIDNDLYYIKKTSEGIEVYYLEYNSQKPQLLVKSTIRSNNLQLIITPGRELYLLADSNLYAIGSELNLISENIVHANKAIDSNFLILTKLNELWLYNPNGKPPVLISRSTTPFTLSKLSTNLGYVFTSHENNLKAIELDTRDASNIYFFGNFSDMQNFSINLNSGELFVLNNNQLSFAQIKTP